MSPSSLAMFAVSIVVLAAAWFSRRSRFAAVVLWRRQARQTAPA